jgi:hypothetical protein
MTLPYTLSKDLELTSNSARAFLRQCWYFCPEKVLFAFRTCSDLLLYYFIYRQDPLHIYTLPGQRAKGVKIWRRHAPLAVIVILISFQLTLVVAAYSSLSNYIDIHVYVYSSSEKYK